MAKLRPLLSPEQDFEIRCPDETYNISNNLLDFAIESYKRLTETVNTLARPDLLICSRSI